jgi:ketol-acid reductoisomerase
MDYMDNTYSTTARRGALDWAPIFEKANLPIFKTLYASVKNGTETRNTLEFNGRSMYRQDLARELAVINNQEIWRAGEYFAFFLFRLVGSLGVLGVIGRTVRSLSPD